MERHPPTYGESKRFLALSALVTLLACENITGVVEYEVRESGASSAIIASFLGGEPRCSDCLLDLCGDQATSCASDNACAAPALCMKSCTIAGTSSTNPACVAMSCPGAVEPEGKFLELTDCAITHCRAECEIGKSWGCSGKYAWPRPTQSFDLSFKMYYFGISGAAPPFIGAPVKLCDKRATGNTDCDRPLTEAMSDSEGVVTLQVKPTSTGLDGAPFLPPAYYYVAPTKSSEGIETFAQRVELTPRLVPLADEPTLPVLSSASASGGDTFFVNGVVFDCRGSRRMAAADLVARWKQPAPCCRDGRPRLTPTREGGDFFYWDSSDEIAYPTQTFLSGIFTHWDLLVPGTYTLEFVDNETNEVRTRYEVTFPRDFDGNIGIFVFPPAAAGASE